MRVAVAFFLLISLATAFKLEKEHPVFEDEPDELDEPAEQGEPAEQDEPDEQDEPEERIEQEEDEDGNKVIEQFTLHCPDKHTFAKLPNWLNHFPALIMVCISPPRLAAIPTVNCPPIYKPLR